MWVWVCLKSLRTAAFALTVTSYIAEDFPFLTLAVFVATLFAGMTFRVSYVVVMVGL